MQRSAAPAMEGSDMATVISAGRIDEAALADLRAAFRGDLISPDDPGYDQARRV